VQHDAEAGAKEMAAEIEEEAFGGPEMEYDDAEGCLRHDGYAQGVEQQCEHVGAC
jgi:hypothetical protein